MDWNDLRFFLAVAQGGSLSAAAAQLGVSPSTVSRRIEMLERALNARLFKAHRDGCDLTDQGRELIPAAERAAAQMRLFERNARSAQPGQSATVRIVAPELLSQQVLLPGLAPFMAAHPDIHIDLRGSVRPVRLVTEDADLILRLVRPEQGNYRIRKVGQIGFRLYGSPDLAATEGVPRQEADLPRHRLIGWPDDLAYLLMARWLSARCPGLQPQLCLASLSAHLAAARQGLGWAVLPDFAARPAGLVAALPEADPLAPDLWLLTHETLARSRPVRAVRAAVLAALDLGLAEARVPPGSSPA